MTAEPVEPLPDPQPPPEQVDIWVRLARSIIRHRHWCDQCWGDAADVLAALDGKPIDEIARRGE